MIVIAALVLTGILYFFINANSPARLQKERLSNRALQTTSIRKTYDDVNVVFLNMESSVRDVTDFGIYAIISSPKALSLAHSSPLFDEVKLEEGRRWVAIVKKRGIQIEEPQMKDFLAKFENEFRQDLSQARIGGSV